MLASITNTPAATDVSWHHDEIVIASNRKYGAQHQRQLSARATYVWISVTEITVSWVQITATLMPAHYMSDSTLDQLIMCCPNQQCICFVSILLMLVLLHL